MNPLKDRQMMAMSTDNSDKTFQTDNTCGMDNPVIVALLLYVMLNKGQI